MDTSRKTMEISISFLFLQMVKKKCCQSFIKIQDKIKYPMQTINADKKGEYENDFLKIRFESTRQ